MGGTRRTASEATCKFKHPTKKGAVTVIHPQKDYAIGTLRNIYKQAGWEWR